MAAGQQFVGDVQVSPTATSAAMGGQAHLNSSGWSVNFTGGGLSGGLQTAFSSIPWWMWAAAAAGLLIYAKRRKG